MWIQLPQKKGTSTHPIFGPCLLWQNGWMDEDAAWYGSRPRLRPQCTRRGPSSRKRGTAPPLFGPCLLWPRSHISDGCQKTTPAAVTTGRRDGPCVRDLSAICLRFSFQFCCSSRISLSALVQPRKQLHDFLSRFGKVQNDDTVSENSSCICIHLN